METVLEITSFYLLLLLMALLVERAMEVLMSVWNYAEWRWDLHTYWTRRAERLRQKYERKARRLLLSPAARLAGVTQQVLPHLRGKAARPGTLTVISADLIRYGTVGAVARGVATGLGIALCALAGLDFVALLRMELAVGSIGMEAWLANLLAGWPAWAGVVVSGVLVGLGAEPVHNVITSLEKRRQARARHLETENIRTASAGGT